MVRCKNTGLKLNSDKTKVKQKIQLYGLICSNKGVRPDSVKVSALHIMVPPTNTQELQAFLGLANYLGPFIPNFSTQTAPLREMIKSKQI